jgi:predicted nucleic acid-binding protein
MPSLIDTNIVIYYFNGLTDDEGIHELLATSFNISIITRIEFLGWSRFAADAELYEKAQTFISKASVFGLSDEIAEKTILLRQQFKTKTPDAIIAATALVNGMRVATNNTDDFKRLGVGTITVALTPEPDSSPNIAEQEVQLLSQINKGLLPQQQQRFAELDQKRQDETLTDSEHQELLTLNELLEQRNVERMQSLNKLAQLRQVPLTTLMQNLGIRTPPYA